MVFNDVLCVVDGGEGYDVVVEKYVGEIYGMV